MKYGFGIDVSLTHGSVVAVEMSNDSKKNTVDGLFSWDNKDSHALSLKSSMSEISLQVASVADAIDCFKWERDKSFVSIDWSSLSVHWRSKRLFAVQMGIMMGMFYTQFNLYDIPLSFISPRTLREYWGLKHNAPKLELQEKVLELYPPNALFESWATEDDIDAYILAVHNILTRGNE